MPTTAPRTATNPPAYDYLFKLLLVGDAGVGKSSTLLRYADDTFTQSYISTIGIDFKVKTVQFDGKTAKLQIWDTAGEERFRTITSAYYRGAHGIAIVYDTSYRSSFDNVRQWKHEIEKYSREDVHVILLGNKKDLVMQTQVTTSEGQALAAELGVLFAEISAKTGEGVEDAFQELVCEVCDELRPMPYLRFAGTQLRDYTQELRDLGIGAEAHVELHGIVARAPVGADASMAGDLLASAATTADGPAMLVFVSHAGRQICVEIGSAATVKDLISAALLQEGVVWPPPEAVEPQSAKPSRLSRCIIA